METLTGAVDPTPPSNGCDLILILDFGCYYTHLLTRRLRSLSLRSLCISGTSPLSYIAPLNPRGIILSGGPHSVHATGSPSLADGFFAYVRSNGIHVLGICYGLQLLVQELGGVVKVGDAREYGRMEIFVERGGRGGLFGADGEQQTVWMRCPTGPRVSMSPPEAVRGPWPPTSGGTGGCTASNAIPGKFYMRPLYVRSTPTLYCE